MFVIRNGGSQFGSGNCSTLILISAGARSAVNPQLLEESIWLVLLVLCTHSLTGPGRGPTVESHSEFVWIWVPSQPFPAGAEQGKIPRLVKTDGVLAIIELSMNIALRATREALRKIGARPIFSSVSFLYLSGPRTICNNILIFFFTVGKGGGCEANSVCWLLSLRR